MILSLSVLSHLIIQNTSPYNRTQALVLGVSHFTHNRKY